MSHVLLDLHYYSYSSLNPHLYQISMHLSPMRCRFTMGWLALFAVLSALCITTESAHLPEGMGNKCFHEPGKVIFSKLKQLQVHAIDLYI